MIDKPLANKNLPGFPVFFLLIFENFFPAIALGFGGFLTPLPPSGGGPKLYQIFYSNLDDLWWSPFVAS